MQTMNLKEYYESFHNMDNPNGTNIQGDFFPFPGDSTTGDQSYTFPIHEQESLSTYESSSYLGINQPCTNPSTLVDKIDSTIKDSSFLPVKSEQTFANQYFGLESQDITNNKAFNKVNNVLADVFKNLEDTKSLANTQPLRNHVFTRNDQLSESVYIKNPNTLSQNQLSDDIGIFTYQHVNPRNQPSIGNGIPYYDQMENRFYNFGDTSLLPPCQPSTSKQATENRQGPWSNISINIGNTIFQSPYNPSLKGHIDSKQYLGETDHNTKYNTSQSFQDMNFSGPIKKETSTNKSITAPKTFYNYNPSYNMENNNFISTHMDIKQNQKTINPYEQMVDISETINNIPFQELTNMNGYSDKSMTNPININNIKSINVHVHYPGPSSSFPEPENQQNSSLLMDQTVPQFSPHTLESNSHVFLPSEPNNVSYLPNMHEQKFVDQSSVIPMDFNLNVAYQYKEPSLIREDIYLPKSEDSFPSPDIDEWLDSIQVTPLEPYLEQAEELGSKSQEVEASVSDPFTSKKEKKRARSRIDTKALEILHKWYKREPYPNRNILQRISEETGLSWNTVKFWFQNRRQILKRQMITHKENILLHENRAEQNLQENYSGPEYSTFYSSQIPSTSMQINDNGLTYSINYNMDAASATLDDGLCTMIS